VIQPRSDAAAVIDYLASFRPPSMDFLLPLDNHDRLPPGMSAACGPSPYGRWLLRAFEHWLTLRPPIVVRTFNTIVALLCGAPSQVEHLGLTPVDLVVIETNGEIEGVDSLKGAFPGATQLGLNVFSHDFDQAAVHTEVLKRQHGRQDLCDTCRSCDVVEVCGAGYLPHRFSTARKFDNPSVYCADLYALIHRIREALIAELQSTSVQSASAASSDFQDNGFSTLDGMTAAHEPIVRLAQSTLAAHKGATVLDLGCGNGMLLREIARRTQAVPFGIEANPERAARAATLLGELGGTVVAGDLFSSTVIWSSGPV